MKTMWRLFIGNFILSFIVVLIVSFMFYVPIVSSTKNESTAETVHKDMLYINNSNKDLNNVDKKVLFKLSDIDVYNLLSSKCNNSETSNAIESYINEYNVYKYTECYIFDFVEDEYGSAIHMVFNNKKYLCIYVSYEDGSITTLYDVILNDMLLEEWHTY